MNIFDMPEIKKLINDPYGQQVSRKKGFWIDVKVYDENDDLIDLECRVSVEAERDPYATGDSPTEYEVEIHEALYNDESYDLSANGEQKVIKAAIEEFTS